MVQEGVPETRAPGRCWLVDSKGLVVASRNDLASFKRPFAHEHPPVATFDEAVEAIRPTAIIGVSTIPKAFDRRVIDAMARINKRSIIFPYSNPTSRAECTAEEAYGWSGGRAIFASGSPLEPVTMNGRTFVPGQGDNVYIFPALGMAVYATEAVRVTDAMFITAARAVAAQVTEADLACGLIYPPQSTILATSLRVAERVAADILDAGLARVKRPADLRAFIEENVYRPEYRTFM